MLHGACVLKVLKTDINTPEMIWNWTLLVLLDRQYEVRTFAGKKFESMDLFNFVEFA